jgi:hypothetical protein
VSRHILESREETREVFVGVELLHFGKRSPIHPMTLTQFQQRSWFDRSFKMQMEFGLRKREKECTGRAGIHSRKSQRFKVRSQKSN